MADNAARPIIIRRKVVKGGGHHGGAWKVAYADFVTAMMAFFLLMWLLNATTEEQRKGLADYFSPSIPVHRTSGGGDGPLGGTSTMAERSQSQVGTGATAERPSIERQASGRTGTDSTTEGDDGLDGIAEALTAMRGESEIADRLLEHVRLRRTAEGLVIEVADLPGVPLFVGETAEPTDRMRLVLALVADVLALATNPIGIDNHMERPAIVRPTSSGWLLTADRALRVREMIADAGIAPLRFVRVTGEADRAPILEDPRDLGNRRSEIVLLHTAADP